VYWDITASTDAVSGPAANTVMESAKIIMKAVIVVINFFII
jgi:hypothetical protein